MSFQLRVGQVRAAKPKRKLKNYKLKHSRLLTCFSAIAYILTVFIHNKTVTPDDAIEMVKLTPMERLEFVKKSFSTDEAVSSLINQSVDHYTRFLYETGKDKESLISLFKDRDKVKALDHYAFGDTIHEMLRMIGKNSLMYRIIVV